MFLYAKRNPKVYYIHIMVEKYTLSVYSERKSLWMQMTLFLNFFEPFLVFQDLLSVNRFARGKRMINYIDDKLIENTYLFCVKRISYSEEAKDLSQDILCEALRAIRSGKSFVSFYSWYWRMARNKYADYIACKKDSAQPLECAMNVAADVLHPIDKLIGEEELSELNYALSRLSHIRREILIRFYLKEQSIAEIADALELPIGTVKSRLFDAKKNLKERLSNMKQIGKSAYAPAQVDWFWGYNCKDGDKVMSQRIAQQISVICRSEAKEICEIADEMGVAAVYLEPILEQMEDVGLVSKPTHNKYLTNFCVFPKGAYGEAGGLACEVFYENHFPERICKIMEGLAEKIKGLDFYGNDFEWKYLMWLGYVHAGTIIGHVGTKYYLQKYADKYLDEAERSYRITMQYSLPEETIDDSRRGETKAVGWSNLHQQFKTAEYGLLEYVNDFQMHPFPAEGEEFEKGRDRWIDGNNIGLLLALAENPKPELNDHQQEMAAEFIKNGLVVKTEEGLRVMLPIVGKAVLAQVNVMMTEALREVAEEYTDLVAKKVEELLLPYVRKDLMSNFIHWDMKMFFQPIPYLLYYGMHETDSLAIPKDYNRSAAGLMIVKLDE